MLFEAKIPLIFIKAMHTSDQLHKFVTISVVIWLVNFQINSLIFLPKI